MKVLQNTTFYNFLKSKTKKGEKLYDSWDLKDINANAHIVVLEKESEKNFTERRIKAATGIIDLSNYNIYTSYIYESSLGYINRHGYNSVFLIENLRNVRKNNGQYRTLARERAHVAQAYYDRIYRLKKQLAIAREAAEKAQKRANAEKLKQLLSVKIANKLTNELQFSNIDAAVVKKYADALNRVNNVNYIDDELMEFLAAHQYNIDEQLEVRCSSCSKRNSNIKFNITLKRSILDLIVKGVYACFLDDFVQQTGRHWSGNTWEFTSSLDVLRHGI